MTPEQVRMLADKYFTNSAEADAFMQGWEFAKRSDTTAEPKFDPSMMMLYAIILGITSAVIFTILLIS